MSEQGKDAERLAPTATEADRVDSGVGDAPEKPIRTFPAIYTLIYRILVLTGRKHGYAMGLHGSLARDLDVIAVPWTEDAAPEKVLIDALLEDIGGLAAEVILKDPRMGASEKPHGRRAWTLLLDGGAFIDLSVMPLVSTPGPAPTRSRSPYEPRQTPRPR